ncbi:MAG: M15 family metallopeptidase [bacterium]|nr:M15 family metallopeptidase [bacterium]
MNGRGFMILALRLGVSGLLMVLAVVILSRAPAFMPPAPAPAEPAAGAGPLVDLSALDPTMIIDLRYFNSDNLVGQALYGANRALLRPPAAERLARVQARLREQGYGLKVWDAYRPLSVQRLLWEALPDPRYVASPEKGSNHNRGAAVDVTLVDLHGNDVEMPSDYDDFDRGHRDNPHFSEAASRHLKILTDAMVAEGFVPYIAEWWHFNEPDAGRYQVLDIPLEGE